jgi:MFS superfamily sulfate permease-like transporter
VGRVRSVKRMRRLTGLIPGLATLTRYDRRWLSRDVLAGISVAAIALPVGLAYADLAGVPAIIGIYSAIFPPLAYALFFAFYLQTSGRAGLVATLLLVSFWHRSAGIGSGARHRS